MKGKVFNDFTPHTRNESYVVTLFHPSYDPELVFAALTWDHIEQRYVLHGECLSQEQARDGYGDFLIVDVVTYDEIRPLFYPDE